MAIRLRGSRIEESQKAADNIGRILTTVGQSEQLRQNRQQLDRVANAIAGGANTLEAIQGVASEPAGFDKGIGGIIQRLSSGLRPQSGRGGVGGAINEAMVSGKLGEIFGPKQRLSEPQQQQAAEIKAGLRPRATAPAKQFGNLSISGANDPSGLPEGTVFQADPQGKVSVISKSTGPQTLTFDEQRKRDLIDAGIETKELTELERTNQEVQIEKNRAELDKLRKGPDGNVVSADAQKASTTLRGEFDSLSKDFRKIRDSFSRIKAVSSDPSAAGDLAIIFNFMKMLDPGSVVRESEFATAENAAGVPDKVRNMFNKALSGERIAFNREDFLNQATNLLDSQAQNQQRLIGRYSQLAKRFGVDPQDVVTEVSVLDDAEANKQLDTKGQIEQLLGGEAEQGEGGFGQRPDGTEKGNGFLGVLDLKGGGVATEFTTQSNAVTVDGKRIDFPTLVPTLTKAEIKLLTQDIIPNGKNIPEPIMQKAIKHAKKRLSSGKSVFAVDQETVTATNPQTGQKLQSNDGGKTWQQIQ